MTMTIALIVSLCSGVTLTDVASRKAALEKEFPTAKVTVRIAKTCTK